MFITIPFRTSRCTEFIAVNPVNQKVIVRYMGGAEYLFRNVSRRKIINLMLNPNMSLGFWNKSLKKNAVKYNPKIKTKRMTYEFVSISPSSNWLPVSLLN